MDARGPARIAGGHLAGFLAARQCPGLGDTGADGGHGAAGLRLDQPVTVRHGELGCHQHGNGVCCGRHLVRLSLSQNTRMGTAVATGHASVRGGLRLHRLSPVQRHFANLAEEHLGPAGRTVA